MASGTSQAVIQCLLAVNEDIEEKQTGIKLNEPQLFQADSEFSDELVIEGMQEEMN